jgi:hypothetical protein
MKDVGDVIRTKPYSAERRVVCYDCYDKDEQEELKKKQLSAYDWLLSLFRIR